MKHLIDVNKIIDFQKDIVFLHPILEFLYPVAVSEDNLLFIYDLKNSGREYEFVKQIKPAMPVPKGIRAAVQITDYNKKASCIVSNEIFGSPLNYVEIFHQFVHCYQIQECEYKIKNSLTIYKQETKKFNFMWEINFPFPFESSRFQQYYADFISGVQEKDSIQIRKSRQNLKDLLTKMQYEYLVWQEWKEGLAKYVEKLIKNHLNIKIHNSNYLTPCEKTCFFAAGSIFIEYLSDNNDDFLLNIEKLFYEMMNY